MLGGEEQDTSQGCPLPRDGVILHPEEQTPNPGGFVEASEDVTRGATRGFQL